jgi:Na+-transporting NADH:ubiquinone oxidoreductase subunit NqrF
VVEGHKRRNISESHLDRVEMKHSNNEYTRLYGNRDEHDHFDDREWHERMLEEQDQTWYFVLADCDGALEMFRDEAT